MQVRKIQSLAVQGRNPTHLRKRRKPLLERCIDFSIDGGAALLVAASLKRLQDERAAELASSADEDDAYAGGVGGGGGGMVAGGAGSGGSSGGGGGQEAQVAPSGFMLDHLHRELQGLLDIKVCLGFRVGATVCVEGAGDRSLRVAFVAGLAAVFVNSLSENPVRVRWHFVCCPGWCPIGAVIDQHRLFELPTSCVWVHRECSDNNMGIRGVLPCACS